MNKVLVVDDSQTVQKCAAIALSGQNQYALEFANSAQSALEKAKAHKPALIMLDLSLSGTLTYDLCKTIKADPALSQSHVVFMSSSLNPIDESKANQSQSSGHILKPFETQAFIDKITSTLQSKAKANIQEKPQVVQNQAHTIAQASPYTPPKQDVIEQESSFVEFQESSIPAVESTQTFQTDESAGDLWSFDLPPPTAEKQDDELPPSNFESMAFEPEQSVEMDVETSFDSSNAIDTSSLGSSFDIDDQYGQSVALDLSSSEPKTNPMINTQTQEQSNALPIQLTEQQIETIVTKVFQNVIERIAWEVVPQLATKIIKEELHRLTKE